jgi:N-acetylmuramoyl-L-alanine amidase
VNSSNIRRIFHSKSLIARHLVLPVLVLICMISAAIAAPPLPLPKPSTRIAIDPGHGGADDGARGPTGLLEKNICLVLARQLALELEARHEVVLTRSDDYGMAHHRRAAIANQAKADVFIGIHAGAAFLHGTNAMTIYYFNGVQNRDNATSEAEEARDQYRWNQAQSRHKADSIELAAALKKSLENLKGPVGCSIKAAPLLVLEGVDMPAILIEVGHITHPGTEKKLSSPQKIQSLSNAIAKGIEAYLASMAETKSGLPGRHP